MLNFAYCNYTNIIFGKDTEQKVGEESAKMGKKLLLHYGGGSIKATGLYDRVTKSLEDAGVEYIELGGVVPNPRLSLVQKGIELCRDNSVDCILAVGGGSVIDSAKAISAGVNYSGNVWDIFENKALVPDKVLPIGVVLTIPAAGSETSFNMVITKEDGLIKKGSAGKNLRPAFAIMNPELSYSLPLYQTACGVADMLAHVMERYFSNTTEVDLSDRLCEAAMRSIINTAPILLTDPHNYGARANIMWAGTIAHAGILGMGREEDWGSHHIEHEISGIYDIAHGAGLAIVFPAWIKYVYKENIPRFHQWAVRVFDVDTAYFDPESTIEEAIRRLEMFFKRMQLPTKLSDAGIGTGEIPLMAKKGTPTGVFKRLYETDFAAILHLAE